MNELMNELKKIKWTTPKELSGNFCVVVLFSAVVTALIYGIDTAVVAVQQAILQLF